VRRLDLRSLRFGGSSEVALRLPVDVAPFTIGGLEYAVGDGLVEIDLKASRVGGRLTLRALGETTIGGCCQRCLEDAVVPVVVECEDYVDEGRSEGDDEVERYTSGGVVDLERWVRDALAAGLPGRIVCREDCRGLCPRCGANLNEAGAHGH